MREKQNNNNKLVACVLYFVSISFTIVHCSNIQIVRNTFRLVFFLLLVFLSWRLRCGSGDSYQGIELKICICTCSECTRSSGLPWRIVEKLLRFHVYYYGEFSFLCGSNCVQCTYQFFNLSFSILAVIHYIVWFVSCDKMNVRTRQCYGKEAKKKLATLNIYLLSDLFSLVYCTVIMRRFGYEIIILCDRTK